MEIREYLTKTGISPFKKWYKKLDRTLQTSIDKRFQRIKILGNLGDNKNLGGGVYELRFMKSSGLRVYFAKEREKIILLLIGGNKSSQSRDIAKAKENLIDYLGRG